jgi:nicotinamidase-related amidase
MPALSADTLRHVDLLNRRTSRLVLVDLQERLLAAMPNAADVVAAAKLLGNAARMFEVPIVVTEHYPRGLGPTTPDLQPFAADVRTKVRFSAAESLAFPAASDPGIERDQMVLAGLEGHICLAQTAFDLLSLGYRVTVVADAVTSRRPFDRDIAVSRMRDAGINITTSEAVVFEWCETAEHPHFKALSALVKERQGGRK